MDDVIEKSSKESQSVEGEKLVSAEEKQSTKPVPPHSK